METTSIVGSTIVFDDAYTGVEKYRRIQRVFGDDAVIRIISKAEAGPNPRRVFVNADERIATITNGTGLMK